jgi:sulfur carrier protein
MQSIEVSINGKPALVPAATTVEAALYDCGYTLEQAAVALNESFLPRDQYTTQLLQVGDRVEVVTPFAGG